MKLNRRGYIAVEIILASIVSITIAVFLIDITIRLVNRTDNNYIDTIFVSDKALLTKNIKEEIENDISDKGVIKSISCSNSNCNIIFIIFNDDSSKTLSIEGNKVTYGSYTKKVDKRLGGEVKVNSSISDEYVIINITFTNIFDDSDYSVIVPISNKEHPPTLAKYITNLYKNASKTPAPNNEIDYNYAPDESLMNDRLGGTTTDLDGGNIRYYGASPNNYIYFNCETYPDTNCELWRIIGVFNGKVKIMRNESIGKYSWDTSASGVNSGYGENEWPEADLMKLLNPGYETESVGESLYYNSKSGNCYSGQNNTTSSCDFTNTGIKNTTKNKIAEVTWNLGGWNDSGIYSNQIYGYERGTKVVSGRSTTWKGRIALPYPSDYGYAVDFGECSKTLYNYEDSTCTSNNWMKTIITSSGGNAGWLLTSNSSVTAYAWAVVSSGFVNYGNYGNRNVSSANEVTPVLYLGSNVIRVDGNGTIDNPYRIK